MKSKCPVCGNQIESKFSDKEKLHYFYCDKCKIGGKGKTPEEANTNFNAENIKTPATPAELVKWSNDNMQVLSERSAQFIDLPAVQRMIKKNTRYAMTADFKKAWNSQEGQESIINALQESFEIGATLPEMGCIVPFGAVVELIPALPAYEHALTTGKNPPYRNIRINCLHENDLYSGPSLKNGVFEFEITKMGFPRGEIIAVIVQAFDISAGNDVGDAYDTQTLMAKAEKHSAGYKYYLNDMSALRKAQSEGKDYIIKWDKKFYEKDIESPYVGADRKKMLEKLAGKSFFAKDMKVRNARAMETERKENEGATQKEIVEIILDDSVSAVKEDIKDAEFEPVEPDKNSESEKKNDLFGGEKL